MSSVNRKELLASLKVRREALISRVTQAMKEQEKPKDTLVRQALAAHLKAKAAKGSGQ